MALLVEHITQTLCTSGWSGFDSWEFLTFVFGRLGPLLDTVYVEDLVALLTVEHGVFLPHVLEADEAFQTPVNQLLDESLPQPHVAAVLALGCGGAPFLGAPLLQASTATQGRKQLVLSGQGQLAPAHGGDGSLNVKGERG